MDRDCRERLSNQLIYYGIAPSVPMPKAYAYASRNCYSEYDCVTGRGRISQKNNVNYNIHILPSITPVEDWSGGVADHGYFGDTYQEDSKAFMRELNQKYGFYNGKNR